VSPAATAARPRVRSGEAFGTASRGRGRSARARRARASSSSGVRPSSRRAIARRRPSAGSPVAASCSTRNGFPPLRAAIAVARAGGSPGVCSAASRAASSAASGPSSRTVAPAIHGWSNTACAPGSPRRTASTSTTRPASRAATSSVAGFTHWASSTNSTSGPVARSTSAATRSASPRNRRPVARSRARNGIQARVANPPPSSSRRSAAAARTRLVLPMPASPITSSGASPSRAARQDATSASRPRRTGPPAPAVTRVHRVGASRGWSRGRSPRSSA
jgi:hypothetical protein